MKKIDPAFIESKKAVCPFCSLGCEFSIVFNDFGIRGIEYLKEGSSGGRLCPRGSAAAMYLNHPRRLSMPMKKDKVIDWSKLAKELNKAFADPNKVAVTFDRNLTYEEYELIVGCCQANGIEHIASSYLEPENVLAGFLDNPVDLDNLASPGVIVVIGDPFSQAPMISKKLINWKMGDRKNRLIVIDSIFTHTASFASDFIPVSVGAEPFVLYTLARETFDKIQEFTSVSSETIKDLSAAIKNAANGMIIVSLPFGHTYDPGLLTESIRTLGSATGKDILPLVEYVAPPGKINMAELLGQSKKGGLNYLINFGELFPYYYPQLSRELKYKEIYATSPLKQNDFYTIPFALNLEKNGMIMTNFGKKKLNSGIRPASGARNVEEILEMLEIKKNGKADIKRSEVKIDRNTRIAALSEKVKATLKKKSKLLVGEKIAFNFMGIFEAEIAKVNPDDAHENGLHDHDIITIESKCGKSELEVKITHSLPVGIVSVPTETAATRGLFDYEIVDGSIYFIPTEVQLWRKE